jgi:hypothetical protein
MRRPSASQVVEALDYCGAVGTRQAGRGMERYQPHQCQPLPPPLERGREVDDVGTSTDVTTHLTIKEHRSCALWSRVTG